MKTAPIKLQEREVFLIGTVLFAVAFLMLAGMALVPFILALIVTSLLAPLMKILRQDGVRRVWAAVLLTALCYLVLVLVLWAVIPPLWSKTQSFIADIPAILEKIQGLIARYLDIKVDTSLNDLTEKTVDKIEDEGITSVAGQAGSVMSVAIAIAGSVTNAVLVLGLTPFITFYYLCDGPRLVDRMVAILPENRREDLVHLWDCIKKRLVGYLKGQFLLSSAEACIYVTGLLIVGLDYAVLIGVSTGIMAVIPVVGKLIMIIIAFSIGFAQFDNLTPFIGIVITYGIVEILEGTILAPKLVGGQIRLHPLLVIAALLIGGYMFGFMGALLALPGAAVFSAIMEELMENQPDTSDDADKGMPQSSS